MRRWLIIGGLVTVPLIIIGILLLLLQQKPQTLQPLALTMWGTQDAATAFDGPIASYRASHPQITITYTQVGAADYYQHLVTAWAQGNGPDLFFAQNTQVGQMSQYAVAMPSNLGIQTVQTTKGLLGNQTKITLPSIPAAPISAYQDAYVDAVTGDTVYNNQLWGLPLSLDTVVTYYNKDLLNNAKIFQPAKTWSELVDQITNNSLVALDQQNNILRAGVGLGTADNVPNASGLLGLLMLQNGATMVGTDGQAAFADQNGQAAVDFYTSFAVPSKTNFTWNAAQPNAKDMFLQGKLAYYFGTLDDRTAITASGLNWGVAPMLHLTTSGDNDAATHTQRNIDLATYQVLMVAKSSIQHKASTAAWNFLTFLARSTTVQSYLKTTGRLSGLKSLLQTQAADQSLSLYAAQLLTARPWYHGKDGINADVYFRELITSVVSGQSDIQTALQLAAQQIQSTL